MSLKNNIAYPPQEIDKVREILSLTPKGKLTLMIERMGIEQKTVVCLFIKTPQSGASLFKWHCV